MSGTPSWSCGHVREQIGAYVVDGLEADERVLVADHLAMCPDCAAEHHSLVGLPVLLDHAAGLELDPPRPALEERVLDAVARERGRRRRPHRARRLLPAGGRRAVAAALAGAVLGAAATALAVSRDEGSPAPAASPLNYAVSLKGAWGASGKAALVAKSGGTSLHLSVYGLPADREVVYEVRCEGGNWSASAGSFRADGRGHAYAVLTTAARPGEYERIRIVRHARGGKDTEVMTGKIN